MSIESYTKPVLIYNPYAGKLRRNPDILQRTIDILSKAGCRVAPRPTDGPNRGGAMASEAIAGGADLVIALGGDGTINEIAQGMVGSRVPLAFLPGGTANVLCCETGIGTNLMRAAARLAECVEERVSVGRFEPRQGDPRYFLAMAGVGLDAAIVEKVSLPLKKATGKFAYWVGGFQQAFTRLEPFKAAPNGSGASYGFALLSRVRNYGGDLALALDASLLAPDFQAVTFRSSQSWHYLFYMATVAVRQHLKMPGVHAKRTSGLELSPVNGGAVPVQLDGELAGTLPATIRIEPAALTLLLPQSYRNEFQRKQKQA